MTELIWDGKYDDKGRKVAPPRIALPFQTVETVNESAAARDLNHELFSTGQATEWRNRLIWGDKKYVLPSLLDEFAGRVNLIYIDPPFATGGDFSFTANVPTDPDDDDEESGVSFTKQPSVIEQKAYRDTWGRGLDGYLAWFYESLLSLRELLSDTGSIYVHLDFNVCHYAKGILDEVFGPDRFRNEIVWKRTSAHANVSQRYGNVHDVIYYYTKTDRFSWNPQFAAYSDEYLETFFDQLEPSGRRYARRDLTAGMDRASKGQLYRWKGITPPSSRCWAMTKENMDQLEAAGKIHWPKKAGGMPRLKLYPEDLPGVPVQDLWTDISPMHNLASERLGYPTQKPEALLERIIKASSNDGDLVLDSFCGSGTTAAVAEKLGRRWIMCDLGRFAIHTARKRFLGIPGVKPFVVQNLGKYERQAWQAAEFGEGAEQAVAAYRRFVLELYHAEPVSGYLWLHGSKSGRMVHVGGVDAPVTMADVTAMAAEFKKAIGKGKDAPTRSGIDVLGWDFAFELNETAKQQAALAGINLRLIRIPRELLEKKAVEQGDIKFFELAALSVKVAKKARAVTLELTDFIIPLDDVPEDVQKAVTHWEQWIDYWAVDWNNSDDTFHNEWQTYRTRKETSLDRETSHRYEEPGTYRVVVKVIDILGNDTTKLLTVEIR
jgi:DNA modification methylase